VVTAVREFLKWAESPAGYRPRSNGKATAGEDDVSATSKLRRRPDRDVRRAAPGDQSPTTHSVGGPTLQTSGLSIPFPIRPEFLAQVVIPRDITVDEARRLGAFILTLAADFKPPM
jgi:hypothetical protein